MASLICIGGEVCNGCGVCTVKEHLQINYSEDDFDSILNSDTLLELLVREIIFDESEVVSTLTHLKSLRDESDEPDTYGDIKNSFHQNENIELIHRFNAQNYLKLNMWQQTILLRLNKWR